MKWWAPAELAPMHWGPFRGMLWCLGLLGLGDIQPSGLMVVSQLWTDQHGRSGDLGLSLTIQEMVHSDATSYESNRQVPLINRPGMLASPMSALSQSQLISQMGMRSSVTHGSPSPPGSKSATPSPSSSTQEEETESHYKVTGEKRPSTDLGKKPKSQKKKKKKDPNEPQKPVSAYALFFRDTQAAIKGQNPNATFGDVSKIVASMWDSLGEEQKQAYKRKTEAAKKEYLKALAAYRASLVSKSSADQGETKSAQSNPPSKMIPPKQPMYPMPPQASSPYPGLGSFLSPSDLQNYRGHPHPGLSRTLTSKPMLPTRAPPQMGQICASGAVKALSVEEAAGTGDAPGKNSLCTWSPSLVGGGGGCWWSPETMGWIVSEKPLS
uniref:TOX high mobility group box family member 2 n=1 Tax=Accipiter nisus TaxID=211598 RepID=A0A8B9MBM1_9AVES